MNRRLGVMAIAAMIAAAFESPASSRNDYPESSPKPPKVTSDELKQAGEKLNKMKSKRTKRGFRG